MLKITALVENRSQNKDLKPARGLSLLLDDGEQKVLFDTGPDATFIENASKLGVALDKVQGVVLSHGHYDHAGGVSHFADYLQGRDHRSDLICHPACFSKRYATASLAGLHIKLKRLDAGLQREQLTSYFHLMDSINPRKIGTRFTFLGEVSRYKSNYGGSKFGRVYNRSSHEDDYIYDDTGIAWQGDDGLVVISGCAHAGIGNMIRQAIEVTGCSKISAVVGGLHLRTAGIPQLRQTRQLLQQLNVQHIHACHCTGTWGSLWLPGNQALYTGSELSFC